MTTQRMQRIKNSVIHGSVTQVQVGENGDLIVRAGGDVKRARIEGRRIVCEYKEGFTVETREDGVYIDGERVTDGIHIRNGRVLHVRDQTIHAEPSRTAPFQRRLEQTPGQPQEEMDPIRMAQVMIIGAALAGLVIFAWWCALQ